MIPIYSIHRLQQVHVGSVHRQVLLQGPLLVIGFHLHAQAFLCRLLFQRHLQDVIGALKRWTNLNSL